MKLCSACCPYFSGAGHDLSLLSCGAKGYRAFCRLIPLYDAKFLFPFIFLKIFILFSTAAPRPAGALLRFRR
jgi:hypothetical protein